jgi:hypothetical protein
VVGGDETVVVVVCNFAIIAAGTSSIQSPAVAAAAAYITCTQRNHSIPEYKTSSSKQTSTKASPNFHFATCKVEPVLYSKVFAVLFV